MSVETVRPLAGLKVLEFGQIVTVPFCGMLLADKETQTRHLSV